jgi:putative endonuclease
MRVRDSSDRRAAVGRLGEDAALRAYLERGFRLVARNWRCALGELDLVLERADLLVFCEVKTRRGSAFGGGFEAVTRTKRRTLRRLAEAYLQSTQARPGRVRFDVASVAVGAGRASVELFEDAL